MITISDIGASSHRAELDAVRTLMAEYAALPHTVGRWLTIEEDLARLPQPFVHPAGALLLAADATRPLGCGALSTFAPEIAEIKRLYVRPEARGRGVGAALLTALLSQAAVLGFARVRLDTAPELTDALALYRRFGFTPIDRYRPDQLPDALCFERPAGPPI